MTAVAVILGAHGNAVALEAVLADIDSRGVDTVVSFGDIVPPAPHPHQADITPNRAAEERADG